MCVCEIAEKQSESVSYGERQYVREIERGGQGGERD